MNLQQNGNSLPLKKNHAWIEVLRTGSMLSVVFLHACALALRADLNTRTWHFFNVTTSLLTISVPVFFMISGALLLNSRHSDSIAYLFRHRLPRLILPLVFWSIAAITRKFVFDASLTGLFSAHDFIKAISTIPEGPVAIHFWFMYSLVPLYLITPLLKRMSDHLSQQHRYYLLGMWLLIALLSAVRSFLPPGYQPFFTVTMLININAAGGYVGYFFLGHFLANWPQKIRTPLLAAAVLFLTVLIAIGTWWKSNVTGAYNEQFKSYISLYVILLASAVFLLVRQLGERPGRSDHFKHNPGFLAGLLAFFSNLSFGIYLMHNVFIAWLYTTGWPTTGFVACIQCFFLTLACSTVGIVLLASIKPLCFICTGLSWDKACNTCNLVFFWQMLKKRIKQSVR